MHFEPTCVQSPQPAVHPGAACLAPRLSHATSTTTKVIWEITRGVHSTISCYSIDIEDIVRSCLGGVGDRVAFVFISVFSTLVCLFLCLFMCFLFRVSLVFMSVSSAVSVFVCLFMCFLFIRGSLF